MRWLGPVAPLVAYVLLCPVPGAAQQGAPPSSAPATSGDQSGSLTEHEVRARELLHKGDVAYRLARFEEALGHYKKAFELVNHPAFLFNIAQAYRQLNNHPKALFYYRLFIYDWKKKLPQRPVPALGEVRAHIAQLSKLVKQRSLGPASSPASAPTKTPPRSGRLTLRGVPSQQGAMVYVDGKKVGAIKPLHLAPGPHRVRVEASGYHPWQDTVRLGPGEAQSRRVDLRLRDHRTLLLITSVSTAAVAAGFFGVGLGYNVEHDRYIAGTAEADQARELSVMGYAVAGGAAALSVVSWTLYLLHRRAVLRRLATGGSSAALVAPTEGGASVVWRVSF